MGGDVILKGLSRRKTRTLLTLLGVAIAVAAIVSLGALAEGLTIGYEALGTGSGADLLVADADAVDIVFSAVEEEVGERLAGLPGVKEVDRMVYTLAATEDVPYFIVFGYDPDGFAVRRFRIVEGEGLSTRSAPHGGRPLLLGRAAADDLDKQVGDTIRLYETTFRIVGIYETGTPFEDGAAVVTVEDAQRLSGHPHQVNAFLIKLRDLGELDRVRERIERLFPDLTVTRSSDFAENQETLAYTRAFSWAVSFLAVLIGGVGVMNTMLMSVFERTREFGTLRAVGWNRMRVLGLVLGESTLLNGLGGVLGVGLGIAAFKAVSRSPAVSGFLPDTLPPALIVQGLGVALAVGLISGIYPAWWASRLPPAEAMRYEGSAGGRAPRVRVGAAVLRNLLRQPTRSALTMLGIGIAITTMVGMGALADGMIAEIERFVGGANVHLVGMQADASIDLSTIDERIVRRIAALPGVKDAEGFLTGYATVGDLPFFVVFGYPPRGYGIQDFTVVEGEPLTANGQIILGRVAAENLNKRVGETIRIFDRPFRIVGIYETGVPLQDGGGVISLRDAQNLFGQPHKVSFFSVRLEDPEAAQAVKASIESRFPEVMVSESTKFAENVTDLQLTKASTWAIALLALVIGGAGMMNTMGMSVYERTREIGVLRALGWRRSRILGMILRESLVLSLLGGVGGVVAALVLIFLMNQNPTVAGFVKMRFSLDLLVQTLLTAFVLGGLGGIYPAWRASRLQPVEALRYE
ncbi:MAG TPA: ABC transporter permease [Chloroflexi bacterium]|nr:ABC transporter permease [Chloroflexota bacterium]